MRSPQLLCATTRAVRSNPCCQPPPGRSSRAGFSLIEVCLAIAIVAFAFVPIIGMLPTGLNTFRSSIDATIGSQIVQRVVDDVQQTDFPSLVATTGTTRYFDTLGNEVAQNNAQKVFDVVVTVTPATALPGALNQKSSNLATVAIEIVNHPGPATLTANQLTALPHSFYSTLVAGNPAANP